MKLRLIDVMFRPIRTSRKIIKLLKDVQLEPKFAPIARPESESNYVVVNNPVMMPAGIYNMIKDSLIRTDTDYVGGKWLTKRHKDQEIRTTKVSFEEAVCMLVQERME